MTAGFFTRQETLAIVEQLAASENLTIVVGAGASVESAFPAWDALVRRLLEDVARIYDVSGDDVGKFVDWVITREGLPASGAIAQAALGEGFGRSLRRALYGSTSAYAPGQTAREVARLHLSPTAGSCDLVTTNYDLLLEQALAFEDERLVAAGLGDAHTIVPLAGDGDAEAGEVLVRHVHGIVPPTGPITDDVVLSDLDYHLMQNPGQWQERYFKDRLETSSCIFVGTSLSDPNLLRYLSWAEEGQTHVVCFARQQDADLYRDGDAVSTAWEATAEARWGALNVRALRADFFSETAQFLYEIEACRRLQDAYVPLAERHRRWIEGLRSSVLSTHRRVFPDRQERFREILVEVVGATLDKLRRTGKRLGNGERVGASLWIFDPEARTLVNWASSDRVWRDPKTMEPVPLDPKSPFVSVQAFCTGAVASRSTTEHVASRWNHVVGVPLYLDDDEHGRLPVGTLTLASTHPHDRSILGRGLSHLRRYFFFEVQASLSELLRPD